MSNTLSDTKKPNDLVNYYNKLIAMEFRHLQLDDTLRNNSLFDLIDHCEILYEKSMVGGYAVENGYGHGRGPVPDLKSYIRGYLVFNYFINSFIILHFKGFDTFIEENEPDFIIYLNLFEFYNSSNTVIDDSHFIPLEVLRKLVLNYLVDRELLSFDVDELYGWLYKYIEYLREKDKLLTTQGEDGEDFYSDVSDDSGYVSPESAPPTPPIHQHISPEPTSMSHRRFSNPVILPRAKTYNGNVAKTQTGDTFSSFENRYPDMGDIHAERDSIPPLPPSETPPRVPKTKIPPLPPTQQFQHQKRPPIPLPNGPDKSVYPSHSSVEDLYFNSKESLNKNVKELAPNSLYTPYQPTKTGKQYKRLSQQIPSQYQHQDTKQQSNYQQYQPHKSKPKISPSQNYPPQNYPLQNYPPQNYPPQNYPPQNYPPNNYPNSGYQQLYQPQQLNYQQQTLQFNPQDYSQNHYPPQHQVYQSQNNFNYGAPHGSVSQSSIFPPQHQFSQKLNMMKELGICGLKNLGSSCYINSTIQLLFGTSPFMKIFTNSEYHKFIKAPQFLRQLKLQKESGKPRDSYLISEAISGLLRTFKQFGGSSITPSKFIRVSAALKPELNIPMQQQDAQEFLLFVLDRSHEELSNKFLIDSGSVDLDYVVSKFTASLGNSDPKYASWYKSLLAYEGSSPINDLFQGHLQNKLICSKCHFESINYSSFSILSLPIPNNGTSLVNLSDCIGYYTQDELLSGENAWNCPKCGKGDSESSSAAHALDNHPVFTPRKSGIFRLGRRNKSPAKSTSAAGSSSSKPPTTSIKRLNFIKLPRVLFIHLSRFSTSSMTEKLDVSIQYPLELKFDEGGRGSIVYRLVGLINHYGNLKSGHYTALVDKASKAEGIDERPYWCLFDDDNVSVNLAHGGYPQQQPLHSRDVYVLSYERVY